MAPTQEQLEWAMGEAAANSPEQGAWGTHQELMTSLAGVGGADEQRAEYKAEQEAQREKEEAEREKAEKREAYLA